MASISKTVRPKRSNNAAVSPAGFGLTAGRGTPSVAGTGNTGWLGNKPAGYNTVISDYPFTDVPPGTDADQSFGTGGWSMIYGADITRVEDATAPVSASYVYDWLYDNGGVAGSGVGNIYRSISPSVSELYVAFPVWHDANFEWNTISNKMFYWEPGNLILQSRHYDNFLSFYNGTTGTAYECNLATPTASDFEGRWALVEYQVIRGTSGSVKVWLDGALVSSHSISLPTISTGWSDLKIDSTWGGATGPRTRDSHRRMDHIYIAHP